MILFGLKYKYKPTQFEKHFLFVLVGMTQATEGHFKEI